MKGPGAGAQWTARILEDTVLSERVDGKTPEIGRSSLSATSGADLLALTLDSLEDDKAEDVVQVNLRGKTDIADHMVIASGRSSRQVAAIADKLVERLKEKTGMRAKVEGKEAGDWVLIDAGDVIVHIFRPEVREFYQLEKMWMPAPHAASRAAGSA